MRVIIGGCGRVGSMLAAKFAAESLEVSVIDKDPAALRRLGAGFRGTTVHGMVFDQEALQEAGIERADIFVAVTSGDNSNVVSATVAREVYRVPTVVARIFDPRRAKIYRRLGIQTVSSVSWATNEIMSLALHSSLVRDVVLGDGEVQLVKFSVPPRLNGRTFADLSSPGELLPVAVVRGGQSFVASPQIEIYEGDIVEIAVLTSAMDRFERLIAP